MAILRVWLPALVAVGIWFLCYFTGQPPAVHHGIQPPTQFSSARAEAALTHILGPEKPDPISSDNNAMVRDRIRKEFVAIGVPTTTHTAFTCNAWRGFSAVVCATVTDIIAEIIPGQGKAITMLAHYDSVPAGPGASDDKSGVVTILETARALKARGGKSLHPVIAVITDGEEAGLLGANAFLQNPALKARVGVAVNMEARGTRGPSLLFQTSPGDGRLIDLYARSVPVMATSSLYAEIYKFLPNDTDLTLFIRDGIPSFNFAFADSVRYYHTPFDTQRNLSHATLQMHGDNLLGVVDALEQTDYAALRGDNDVYVSVLGLWLPRIPETLALPLAVIVLLAIAAAAFLARNKPFAWKPSLFAALMPPVLAAGCLAIGFVLAFIAQLLSGHPDPTYAYPINMRLALGFGVFAMTVLVSRMATLRGAAASAWLWMAALGVATAIFLPGFSPYFIFPSLIAAVLLLATARMGWESPLGQAALIISAIAALIIWVQLVCSGETLMGLRLHPLFTIPAAFGLMTLVPLLAAASASGWRWSAAVLAVASLACAVAAGFEPSYSKESPQRINIAYYEHPDAPARWIADTSWKAVGTEPLPPELANFGFTHIDDAYPPLGFGDAYARPAGAPHYPLPVYKVLNDRKSGNERIVTIELDGSPQASGVLIEVPKGAQLHALDIRGQHQTAPAGWSGPARIACLSRDCGNLTFTLTLGNTGAVAIPYAEERYGLPDFAAPVLAARPNTAMPSQSGDTVLLANEVKLPAL